MVHKQFKYLMLLLLILPNIMDTELHAQQSKISVASFQRMESDLTARVTAPKRDQNGEICALIRIVTNVKDFMFEPDALGITARENKTGEIWLYVPRGARRISILHDHKIRCLHRNHPDFHVSSNLYFGIFPRLRHFATLLADRLSCAL